MKIDLVWIDVSRYVGSGTPPVYLLERPLPDGSPAKRPGYVAAEVAREGVFWVPQGPVTEPVVPWTFVGTGAHVRIPIHAHETLQLAASSILAAGIEIGMKAVLSLRTQVRDEPQSVTLVLGHECTDMRPTSERYRFYVGIAIRTG